MKIARAWFLFLFSWGPNVNAWGLAIHAGVVDYGGWLGLYPLFVSCRIGFLQEINRAHMKHNQFPIKNSGIFEAVFLSFSFLWRHKEVAGRNEKGMKRRIQTLYLL